MDIVNISQEIYNTAKRIESGVNTLHQYAAKYAEAEKEYRFKLAREIMKLKEEKTPMTIISDVARGNIAEHKFKRDLAEVEYKTSRDMLNALQSELSALQTLYRRQDEI